MNHRRRFGMLLGAALLVLAGCASAVSPTSGAQSTPSAAAPTPSSTSQVQVAHVALSDNGITADPSTLSAGTPYQFVVTNTGQVTYQFVMGLEGGSWGCCHMRRGWQQQFTAYQSHQIAPEQTQTFDYTLPASAVGPYFGFGCYQQGAQEGMWHPVTVRSSP